MYVHAHFQDVTIYNNKVTREEVELFDQPYLLKHTIWSCLETHKNDHQSWEYFLSTMYYLFNIYVAVSTTYVLLLSLL